MKSLATLIVPCALFLCPSQSVSAAAQTIHICVDGSGAKIYQDTPCAPQTRTLATREYLTIVPDPAVAARSREIETEMNRRYRGAGGRSATVRNVSRKSAGPSPCEAAKAKRKATLDRVGLKRTFDLLSQLDSEVWAVCKGF